MKKINEYINEYQNKYVLKIPNVYIYIPKKNGKPCIVSGCRWYVYFYFNDKNGIRKQFKFYQGINRIKSLKQRKQAANSLKQAIESYLQAGNNPFELFETENKSFNDAFSVAYKEKRKDWTTRTANVNKNYFDKFTIWAEKNNLHNLPVKSFKKTYILAYLSFLKDNKLSNTSVNNHRGFLGSVFAKMSALGFIEYNYIKDIEKLKEKPQKNKAFSINELKQIKEYLKANDKALYLFIQVMTYTFLRPIEVARLKVGDINLDKKIIYLPTKTENSIIPVIDKLEQLLIDNNLLNYDKNFILITYKAFPFDWNQPDRTKYFNFQKRFLKVKKHFNFGHEYGLYSFRHTFAKMLYNKFLADGLTDLQAKHKLMTITRHKSISSLNKYLRGIGAFVPDDYSDDFTFDF